MTRRDFILISETLKAQRPAYYVQTFADLDDGRPQHEVEREIEWKRAACSVWNGVVQAMATALATTCPRFDRERFLKACGMES